MKTRKRMQKSLLILLLCLGLVFSLTGCGTSGNNATDGSDPVPSSSPNAAESVPDESESTPDDADTGEDAVTIEPQVLYDANDIKITLTNFGYDLDYAENVIVVGGGAWLNLTVENNTEGEIYVGCRYAMVNGIMIEPLLECWPAAGEAIDATLELDYDNLIESNISTINSVWFVISIVDMKTQTSIDTKYVQLSTSAADYVQPEYTPSGTPVLDENGIKAYYLNSEYDGVSWIYYLYIENSTEKVVSARLNDSTADGTDASAHTYLENGVLFPSSAAFARIRVQTEDEDYAGNNEIEVLTGVLTATLLGDDSTVYASAQVSLSPKD